MKVTISRTNDPFKKYWWVILLVFGVVGGFLCMPSGDASSGGFSGSAASKGGEQSLDSPNNPNGAPGSAVDLSMDGSGASRKGGPIMSSLYQAPEEEKASTGTLVASAGGGRNFADALKDVSRKSSASSRSASADASGWGGEKAQKGFTAPKIGASGFSNIAGGGGGGGGGGGELGGSIAFGGGAAKTGVSFAKGLKGAAGDDALMKNATASMRGLNTAANSAMSAVGQRSADAAMGMAGQSFDGTSGRGGFAGGAAGRGPSSGFGDGGAGGAGAGAYNKLDMAPVNLKKNETGSVQKNIQPPIAKTAPPEKPSMMEMIKQMIITGLIGAIVNGIVGAII